MATEQSQPQQSPTFVDRLTDHLESHPHRPVLLGIAFATTFLDWVTVSIMGGGGRSIAGYTIMGGRVYIGLLLALIFVEFAYIPLFHDRSIDSYDLSIVRRFAWLGVGTLLTITSIGSIIYINSMIDEMYSELGIFSGAVNASIGLGLYLALLAGVAIGVLGYADR